jgi:hypothetical protein
MLALHSLGRLGGLSRIDFPKPARRGKKLCARPIPLWLARCKWLYGLFPNGANSI